jgi:hypothetical protein
MKTAEQQKIGRLEQDLHKTRIALDESVKLQAHYAGLLNAWDGGERRIFKTSDEWIARLEETGTIEPV